MCIYIGGGTRGQGGSSPLGLGRGVFPPPSTFKDTCNIGHRNPKKIRCILHSITFEKALYELVYLSKAR